MTPSDYAEAGGYQDIVDFMLDLRSRAKADDDMKGVEKVCCE